MAAIAALALHGLSGCAKSPVSLIPPPFSTNNLIQQENAKPGSNAWVIPTGNIASNHQIEGYASANSVNRGESISFFVSTADPSFRLEIFRLGWYQGNGARLVASNTLAGGLQAPCSTDATTLVINCAWQSSSTLQLPAPEADGTNNWTSGIYLAKLTGSTSNKSSYIPFVVRDDARKAEIRFASAMNTWEAYNEWGGTSLYTTPRAFKVSFNRPFFRGTGGGDLVSELWEMSALRFLEREGYDVSYAADVDALNASELLNHKVLLFPGHHEYWSTPMRDNVQAAINAGVHAVFFGSNNVYWQVRYEADATGAPNRVMVCYKSTQDPMATTNPPLTTVQFREPPVNSPEETMLGVMFNSAGVDANLVVSNPSHWIFDQTGASKGQSLGAYLGEEVDGQSGLAPPGTTVLMESPYVSSGGSSGISRTTIFQAPSGAFVFSSGTSNFPLGLDNIHTNDANPVIIQMVRNLLAHLGATR